MLNLKVEEDDVFRLDVYLAEKLGEPRRVVQSLIRSHQILVNGVAVKSSYKPKTLDSITVNFPQKENCFPEEKLPDLDLIYEDQDIIVLNKVSGVVVHPNDVQKNGTLLDALLQYFPDLSSVGEFPRHGIVHRLDKDTSGLMVIAKTYDAFEHLKMQFKNRTVDKRYVAVVQGNIQTDSFMIDQPLKRHARKRYMYTVSPDGKDAQTEVNVIKRYNSKTIVEAKPITGRTHQIRVHLSFYGNPILGDPLYHNSSNEQGQQLQAYFLSFVHPKTQAKLSFSLNKLYL